MQRAITRAAAGKPTGLTTADEMKYFGCLRAAGPRPRLVELVCGIRSGKSVISGVAALHSALTADLSRLPLYERARVPIVAPTKETADITFRLLSGAVNASLALKGLLAPTPKGKPGETGSHSLTVRRADGRLVDIVVVAAHRGGITIRGSWLAGFILEETAFFGADEKGYKVNAEELLRAGEGRLVPGGQGWIVSSAMGAEGLLYDLWKQHFGKDGSVLVVHAPTLAMNNITVDAAMVEDLRTRDPDAAAREFDAVFTDGDASLIETQFVDKAMRKGEEPLAAEPGHQHTAAMDPATRGNAWTLVIATKAWRDDRVKRVVVYARQWQGSKTRPLSPNTVLKEQAMILRGYGVTSAATDQHSADANRDIARRHGLTLYDKSTTQAENTELFESLRTMLADESLELPNEPFVRQDLLAIRKRVTNTISIVLPRTPDGRHCDYASSIARVVSMGLRDPPPRPVTLTTEERHAAEASERRAMAMAFANKRQRKTNKANMRALKRGDFGAVK